MLLTGSGRNALVRRAVEKGVTVPRPAGAVVGAVLLVVSGTASTATPQRPAADRVCAAVRQEYKRYASFPSLPHWIWTIPHGCVFVRDLAPTADCRATDVRNGCAPPPDVHVRYRRRAYVFHLTLKGVPAKAKGL